MHKKNDPKVVFLSGRRLMPARLAKTARRRGLRRQHGKLGLDNGDIGLVFGVAQGLG